MKTNPPITLEELRARRAQRGLADPLNRLSAAVACAIENGAEIAVEKRKNEVFK